MARELAPGMPVRVNTDNPTFNGKSLNKAIANCLGTSTFGLGERRPLKEGDAGVIMYAANRVGEWSVSFFEVAGLESQQNGWIIDGSCLDLIDVSLSADQVEQWLATDEPVTQLLRESE